MKIGYNFKFDFERLKEWNNIRIFLLQKYTSLLIN